MLDLETLGNKPGSVIASIGAVKFGDGKIIDKFYRTINMQSCVRIGIALDDAISQANHLMDILKI